MGATRLPFTTMNIGYLQTPMGAFKIASDGAKLKYIKLLKEDEKMVENADFAVEKAKLQLAEYLSGQRKNFDLPLDLQQGTEFQQKVWKALQNIPYGQTRSYGTIAREVGSPRGARAVGNAVHNNPFLIVVPCHRVINGDGTIGGFGEGIMVKRNLFAVEDITELCK